MNRLKLVDINKICLVLKTIIASLVKDALIGPGHAKNVP